MFEWLVNNTDLCMAIMAICSFVVSVVALFIAIYTVHIQRKQNILAVKPVLDVFTMNYRNEIGVEIINNGLGPLFVKKVIVKNKKGEEANSIIDLVPCDISWKNFIQTDYNFSLRAGDKLPLITLCSEKVEQRNRARKALDALTIKFIYADAYENEDLYELSLEDCYPLEKEVKIEVVPQA